MAKRGRPKNRPIDKAGIPKDLTDIGDKKAGTVEGPEVPSRGEVPGPVSAATINPMEINMLEKAREPSKAEPVAAPTVFRYKGNGVNIVRVCGRSLTVDFSAQKGFWSTTDAAIAKELDEKGFVRE